MARGKEILSTHGETSKCEMASQQRPEMPAEIYNAAINGNNDFLVQHLGLHEVTIHKTVPLELASATRFGDTLLHLLITGEHNDLALKVFSKDKSLLKAHNNKLETPLHTAANVGNEKVICDLIEHNSCEVKDALRETNANGDTALHVAVYHNHEGVVKALMKFDPEVAQKENRQDFSPLYIATVEGYTSLVKAMLQINATLLRTQFSGGMFPVHVAARMGNSDLVKHLLQEYLDYAELLDSCQRNLFHIAAEQKNENVFFTEVFVLTTNGSPQMSRIIKRMINAKDYEGNTPLHTAAMKGHCEVMRAIWNKLNQDRGALLPNQKGKTAFDLSVIQVRNTSEVIASNINRYIKAKGSTFSGEWFDNMFKPPSNNEPERLQTIGLGSVLITTVAFAAAFAVPGGYNYTDGGTPGLGRRYMYRAFVLANTLAFLQGFGLIFVLGARSLKSEVDADELQLAIIWFLGASNCMMIAFGSGSFVVLAPVSMPIAIIVFVLAILLATPFQFLVVRAVELILKCDHLFQLVVVYILPFLFVFFVAIL